MLSNEFVTAYRHSPNVERIHKDYPPEITEAQDKSLAFGRLLHDVFRGVAVDQTATAKTFANYETWIQNFDELEDFVLQRPDGWRLRNELNFHGLNAHMFHMWLPLIHGNWKSDAIRKNYANTAQNSLAFHGLLYYELRQKYIDERGAHRYYAEGSGDMVGRFTGMLQEYDAAIIALDLVHRNPNLTVVPAPWQFEHARPATNADLIVADVAEKRAVGVQIRTQVRQQAVEDADPDRIVFIDGTNDLGNVRALRTRQRSSDKQVKAWPGIISAKRIHEIPTRQNYPPGFVRMLMQRKFLARQLMQDIKYDHRAVCQRVGERILAKL